VHYTRAGDFWAINELFSIRYYKDLKICNFHNCRGEAFSLDMTLSSVISNENAENIAYWEAISLNILCYVQPSLKIKDPIPININTIALQPYLHVVY